MAGGGSLEVDEYEEDDEYGEEEEVFVVDVVDDLVGGAAGKSGP